MAHQRLPTSLLLLLACCFVAVSAAAGGAGGANNGGPTFMSGQMRQASVGTASTSRSVSHEYSASSGMKINEANILLPYTETDRTVQFQLTTSGSACFMWQSSNVECATVTPVPHEDDCHEVGIAPDVESVVVEVSKRAAAAAAALKSGGTVAALPNGDQLCTSHAIVTATSRVDGRTSAVIKARANDDYYLRCDVFVARVSRLDISTVIERIGVGTTYTVSVTAYDEHDNTFSSLEGLRFQWSTSPHTEILTIAKLSKSQKRVSHLRETAEREAWSDAVVLHGIQTGRVNITVKLTEPGYEHLEPATKEIKVVERPDLIPSSAIYITPAERVQYTLTRMMDFRDVPIDMPDPNFRWRTGHADVAVVDDRMGLLTGVNKGRTHVVVSDLRLDEDMTHRTVFVVEPTALDLTLTPVLTDEDTQRVGFDPALELEQRASSAGNWHVIYGREYIVNVELIDDNFNRIYIGENVRFEVSLDEGGVGVEVLALANEEDNLGPLSEEDGQDAAPGSIFGTTFRISGKQLGEVVVSARLRRVVDSVTGHEWRPIGGPLRVVETAVVADPVVLVRPKSPILLPEALLHDHHNVTLEAIGGSGKYSYHKGSTGNADVFQVTSTGLVVSGVTGINDVVVRDLANPFNFDTGTVQVVPAASLAFLPSEVEVEVGGTLRLFATAHPDAGALGDVHMPRTFHTCIGMHDSMLWRVHDPLLKPASPATSPTASDWRKWQASYHDDPVCSSNLFVGAAPGFTTVQIVYGTLVATIRVSVFEPLRVMFPPPQRHVTHADAAALVALGCDTPIVLQGGPAAWALGGHSVGGRSEVDDRVIVPDKSQLRLARAHVRPYSRQYAYIATCLEHGEQNITFRVANVASKDYIPVPVVSTVTVAFSCAPPRHAWLRLASNATDNPYAASAAAAAAAANATSSGSPTATAAAAAAAGGVPLGVPAVPSVAATTATPGTGDMVAESCPTNFDATVPHFDEATLHLRGPESYVVRTNQTVPVLLDMFDGSTPPRRFLNFSTVRVRWALSDDTMAAFVFDEYDPRDAFTAAGIIASLVSAEEEDDEPDDGIVCVVQTLDEWPGAQSRLVKLGTKTGVVKVTATAQDFFERMLRAAKLAKDILTAALAGTYFTAVRHSIKLELVDQVALVPAYAVLFNHPLNVLRLSAIGGSGRFQYAMNNSLATMTVDRTNEFVDLAPAAPGLVTVTVFDIGLETSRSASSSVLISDAHRVVLRVRDQIALGATVPLFVDVIDAQGNYFPSSQYRFMDLTFALDACQLRVADKQLASDTAGAATGDAAASNASASAGAASASAAASGASSPASASAGATEHGVASGRPFDLTGLALGSARLVASVRHSGVGVADVRVEAVPAGAAMGASTDASLAQSDPVLIHVFPPLQLLPKFLSLVPEGRFVLRLEGGPRASSIGYFSSDPSVATVTAAGEVTAVSLGTVTITAQAWGMDSMTGERAVLAEAFMVLTVDFPKNVDIFVPTSRLLVGESLKLVARSRRGQSPFSFSGANVSFAWQADDSEVLALHPVHPSTDPDQLRAFAGADDPLQDAFAAWVAARRVGQTLVRITVNIESQRYGRFLLQDTHTFTCVAKLKLLSPAWMLLPPGARARIRTNQDHDRLSYSLLTEQYHAAGVQAVDGVGHVTASDAPGTSIVVVRDQRNEQWVSVKVEVKAVSHIALRPTAPYFATIPVGATTLVRIELRDDLGRMFHLGPDVSIGIGHSVGVGTSSSSGATPAASPAGAASAADAASATPGTTRANGTYAGGPCSLAPASSTLETGFGALRTLSNDMYVAGAEIVHNATVAVSAKREGDVVIKIWLPYVHFAYANEARAASVPLAGADATGSRRTHLDDDDDLKALQRWTQDEIVDDVEAEAQLHASLLNSGLVELPFVSDAAAAGGAAAHPGAGRRLMALSDGRMLADYLTLRVVNVLRPQSPVTVLVGGQVQFEAFQPDGSNWVSYWASADDSMISIDRDTGLAHAHRVGRGTIYYHSSAPGADRELESTPTHATVEVVRLDKVTLTPRSAAAAVTNYVAGRADHADPVVFDVSFADDRQRPLAVSSSAAASKHVRHNIKFSCGALDTHWASAYALGPGSTNAAAVPTWLTELLSRGAGHAVPSPVCVLVPRRMPAATSAGGSNAASSAATGRTSARHNGYAVPTRQAPQALGVEVVAHSSNKRSQAVSDARVPFVPGFVVQATGAAASLPVDEEGCWVLSRAMTSGRLAVYGDASGLSVTSSNEALVTVAVDDSMKQASQFAPSSVTVDIAVSGATSRGRTAGALLPAAFRSVAVHLVHSATEQRHELCVSFDDGSGLPDAGSAPQTSFDNFWLVAFLSVVVILLLAVLVRVVFARTGPAPYSGAAAAGSMPAGAHTPSAPPATPRSGAAAPFRVSASAAATPQRRRLQYDGDLMTPSRFKAARGLPPSAHSVVGESGGMNPYISTSGRRLPLRGDW